MKHLVLPVKWKDDPKGYMKHYHANLSAKQREEKAARMKLWWKSDQGRYASHKARAKRSNIEFQLSFEDWLRIWKDSGHYHERSAVGYVMCRNGDIGPYAVDNVYIATASQNKSEAWYNNRVCLPNTGQFYKDLND